jgi:hypothetical protein
MTTPRLLALLVLAAGLVASACAAPAPEPSRPNYEPPRPAPPVSSALEVPAAKPAEPRLQATSPAAGDAGATDPGAARTTPANGASSDGAGSDAVIAFVDGKPVWVSELLSLWLHRESREVYDYLQTVIDAHVAEADARSLGIVLDERAVEQALTRVKSQIEAKLQEQQPGITLATYATERLGLDPEHYVQGLRANQRRGMLLERVVRTWLLAQENAVVRVIIVVEEERAKQVEAALAAGRDFAEVARELSQDETARRGGELPPVIRTERLLLSRLAFATAEGAVTGPVEDSGRTLWVHVEEFRAPLEGPWLTIAPAIEQSLAERPVDDFEFLQWKSFSDLRHEKDHRPFFELAGEPTDGM